MQTYGIGGNEVPTDANEALADIPKNRTLLVEKLTDKAPVKPEITQGLKTIDEVFQHFKPQVSVELQSLDGVSKKEELKFSSLGDFGANGITKQSPYLQNLKTQKDEFQKIIKQLRSNKVMRSIVADPEKSQAMLKAIQVMIKELNKTDIK
jgi:predicted component of type VI protein secretion system